MTAHDALRWAVGELEGAAVPDPETDAYLLLEAATGMDRAKVYLHGGEELEGAAEADLVSLVKKRMGRVPLQYILGSQEFMGLSFRVNSNVLIPRQDTETLVEEALKVIPPGGRVLDLCTGSGCVAISLRHFSTRAEVVGSDISKAALAVARENSRLLMEAVEWVSGDLFAPVEGRFDVIVSNPPYIPGPEIPLLQPEVRDFEPLLALDGEEDGLAFYRRIVPEAPSHLGPGGSLLVEIGSEQGEAVAGLFARCGFQEVSVVRDLAGLDRVVRGRWDGSPRA